MNAKTRIEKLEAQAAPQGRCPHDHIISRWIKPDGSDSIAGDGAKTCECGRDLRAIEIQFVPYTGAKACCYFEYGTRAFSIKPLIVSIAALTAFDKQVLSVKPANGKSLNSADCNTKRKPR